MVDFENQICNTKFHLKRKDGPVLEIWGTETTLESPATRAPTGKRIRLKRLGMLQPCFYKFRA